MELREPSPEPTLLRLLETTIPISFSSQPDRPVVSALCAGATLADQIDAAHKTIYNALSEGQKLLEAELYQLAQSKVYGTTYTSQKTRRDGGDAMATVFEQVEQEVFEVCRTDHTYRSSTVIETAAGKIGTRYKYINPKDGTGSYRRALEREAACRQEMERVKQLKKLRKKILSRLGAIAKREAEDRALLQAVIAF